MVNAFSVNIKQNPFGTVERIGETQNGRALYKLTDSDGKSAGKLTIPLEQVDTFESSYNEILDIAPKIQDYVANHSSEKAIKQRRNKARAIVGGCGIVGAAIPIVALTKSTSITKKILGAVAGIVSGLAVGFVASLGVTTPPGSIEFAKATRTLSKLDIQPVLDETV